MAEAPKRRYGVQALDRAVQILRTFDLDHPERGVSEIARLVGLSPSTTHRLLASLHEHGILRKEASGTRYALGPDLLRLAQVAHLTLKLSDLAQPIMVELRDATDETAALHVADQTPARVVVAQVESKQPLRRIYTEIGQAVPIHEGAPGKVLLAHLPPVVIDAVLAKPLAKATPKTIVDPHRLRAVLVQVREQGYATSIEERIPGISTVAVPVHDHNGNVTAALSVSGPSSRVTAERLTDFVAVAKVAGRRLSVALGYAPHGMDPVDDASRAASG